MHVEVKKIQERIVLCAVRHRMQSSIYEKVIEWYDYS